MDILDRLLNSSPDEGSHELQCRCLDAAAEIARQRDHISILEIAFRESQATKLWKLMDIGNDLTPNVEVRGAEPACRRSVPLDRLVGSDDDEQP